MEFLHQTNGVLVKFDDTKTQWFEPACLKVESEGPVNNKIGKRLLPFSSVYVMTSGDTTAKVSGTVTF